MREDPMLNILLAEIQQAMEDFQLCKNGFENARRWQSEGISRSMVRH